MKIEISNYAQINENESNEVQIKILLYIAGTAFELQKGMFSCQSRCGIKSIGSRENWKRSTIPEMVTFSKEMLLAYSSHLRTSINNFMI